METSEITFATGCSGIGAPEMAWHDRLGWKCLWCSEIEPFPCAVLKYRWPETPNAGDFLTLADRIAKDELEAPDVFIAGTPCQAFSVAGLRESLNDERGNLTIEYIKIANAMDEQRRRHGKPETVFVWENVPGVLSTKDNAFGCFLGGLAGLSGAVAAENGQWNHYGSIVAFRTVAWRILDAQYFGVAQRRRRVFVIGTARPGFSATRRLFERGSVPRPAPPCRETREGFAPTTESHLNVIKCYEFNPTDTRVKETEISPTVLSRWGTGGNQIPLAASCGFARRLTTVECARLQGFPDHHTEIPWRGKPAEKCPRAPQYKAYGNSMCVNVIEWLGRGIAEELANPAPFEIHYPEQQTFNF